MTGLVKIPPMRPEPERDRWGRYVLPDPASGHKVSWTRATTLKDALKDKEGLIGWKQRMAVLGTRRLPGWAGRVADLQAAIDRCGKDWKSAKPIKDALRVTLDELHAAAGGNEGSDRGTQAHTLTEYADAGRLDEVRHLATDSELADLRAYLDCCDREGIVRPARWIERIVINLRVASAGTFDRLVYLPDGRLVCADVKSQQDFDFGFLDAAAQMGQYVNADAMWDYENQRWEPLPADLDRKLGIIMHVPVGKATCTLYEVDLVQGWESAQIAFDVRLKRAAGKVMGKPYISRPVTRCPECLSPDEDPRAWCDCQSGEPPCRTPCRQNAHRPYQCPSRGGDRVMTLIRSAGHPDALVALWRDLNARGQWTAEHTEAAAVRKAQLAGTAITS